MANLFDTFWHHIDEHKNQHLVELYAKRAGIDKLEDTNVFVYLNQEDTDSVNDYWEDIDADSKYVAIHTTSGAHPGTGPIDSKDWDMDKFNILVSNLETFGYKVIQIGSFSDRKLSSSSVIDFTGKFTFKQNAEVFKRCKAFIGVDSGPAYLAAFSGIPCIMIMGATQNLGLGKGPNVGPIGNNVHYINSTKPNNKACQPTPCYIRCQIGNGRGCISSIGVNDVLSKFSEVVK
jgi:ADP-heptose:LPS heptosyltransferase